MINEVLRKVLLWAALNPWLAERLPNLPFMRKAVDRFMPGEEIADALGAAVDLQVLGIGTIYTKLGEAITDPAGAQAVADHYVEAARAGSRPPRSTASSASSPRSWASTSTRTSASATCVISPRQRQAQGSYLWIDMEDSSYVDRTLDLYQRLRASHANTGICLQAYLRRTAKDIERLLPLGPAIRLVKGAYDEPKDGRLQVEEGGRRELPRPRRDHAPREPDAVDAAWASGRTTST